MKIDLAKKKHEKEECCNTRYMRNVGAEAAKGETMNRRGFMLSVFGLAVSPAAAKVGSVIPVAPVAETHASKLVLETVGACVSLTGIGWTGIGWIHGGCLGGMLLPNDESR